MQITKVFTFDAGHRLSDYEGKCKRLHGHTYHLEVTVEGELNKKGMVMDFGDLKSIFNEDIDSKFDHRFMLKIGDKYNEAIAKALPKGDGSICWVDYNPTAENIAKDILEILKKKLSEPAIGAKIAKVRLYETPTSFAEITSE